MKYTRYDLNKKNGGNGKMMIFLILIVVAALGVSTLLAKFIFSGNGGDKIVDVTKPISVSNIDSKNEFVNYTLVQCGYYSKKENAEELKQRLKDRYNAVNILDNEKYRVVTFIGSPEDAGKIVDKLNGENLNSLKINFQISNKELCNQEISGMINGYLQILNKLQEAEVKSVKTDEFKKWVNGLTDDKNSESFKIYEALKKNINELPDEITKMDIEKGYTSIFTALNNYKVK
jgi:hypothetical protein